MDPGELKWGLLPCNKVQKPSVTITIQRIIASSFSSTNLLPQVSIYTELVTPTSGNPYYGYFTCANWNTVDSTALQTVLGNVFSSFTTPQANICTEQGDEHMYCMNDTGQKRYCHCEAVSLNNHKYPVYYSSI